MFVKTGPLVLASS